MSIRFTSTAFHCGSDNSKTNLYLQCCICKVNIYTILSVNLAQATQIWKLNKGLNDMLDFASLITSSNILHKLLQSLFSLSLQILSNTNSSKQFIPSALALLGLEAVPARLWSVRVLGKKKVFESVW